MKHIGQDEFKGVGDMRGFYRQASILPTSELGDIALIRSHIMYHAGHAVAERAYIAPSRGHSYKVNLYGERRAQDTVIVKIRDHYDHRDGVTGLFSVTVKS